MNRIPVILDTDIGSDIDDTWALGFMLKCPELKLEFALSATGDTRYRAKLIAKMVEIAGYGGVTIGMGDRTKTGSAAASACLHKQQAAWIEDYRLQDYPGIVRENGVEAMIETVMRMNVSPALVCIGPLPNIRRALELEPRIAPKCNFIGIYGSVRRGYHGSPDIAREYNVIADVEAAKTVFSAPWKSMAISPTDTCGYVSLYGPKYQRLLTSRDPVTAAIIENYRNWRHIDAFQWNVRSSLICDAVATYLAFDDKLLNMETLPISVSDDGYTRIDPEHGRNMRVATGWKDLQAFEDLLVSRLAGDSAGDGSAGS